MIDNNQVVQILYEIEDPTGNGNIIDTGRVKNLQVRDQKIYFELIVGNLDTGTRAALHMTCQEKMQSIYPDAEVHIHMITDRQEAQQLRPLPQIQNIVAIASGKGGVGKSTISANLARALANQGLRVGLIDADLYGPSLPIMFGMAGQKPELRDVHGKAKVVPLVSDEGIHLMSVGFIIAPEQAVVLRGPRLSGILKQFINDTLWPELDILLIDLPPGTGDIQLTLVQTVPVTGALIVTTPQEVAVADALKAANMFRLENIDVPILGVVENMSWFTPEDAPDRRYLLFGQGGGERLAQHIGCPLLAHIPLIIRIRESGDQEMVIDEAWLSENGLFGSSANALIRALDMRHRQFRPTQRVKVQ